MAGSTRIKGNKLKLAFGTPAVDYWADATAVTLENEEGETDTTTFADAAEGGARQFFLNISSIQSTQATSFWRNCWDNSGAEIPFTYAPHGNAVATEDEPHFVGTCIMGPKPTIGGEAGTGVYTFETRFDVVGTPVLDAGAGV